MKHKISSAVEQIPFSVIREMSLRALEYENVIPLGIGEPDFNTPKAICRSAASDALAGATHYTPSNGDLELIEAICDYLSNCRSQTFSPENIVVTAGGMGALTAYFRTVLSAGDEVLIPEPYFPAYRPQIEWVGGKVVGVPCRLENGFVPSSEDLVSAVTPRTKVLVLNYPNNPTGAVIAAGDLDRLAQFAVNHDLLVVSDEVYEKILFQDKVHESPYSRPGMAERTVVVHSFSKSYAMTGWRIGYAFGPPWIIDPMAKVVSYYTSCASSVSQRAALYALRADPQMFEEMVATFERRNRCAYEGLSRIPGLAVHRAAGAFYLFPDIHNLTMDSRRFALELLEKEQVAVVPGEAFGPCGKGFFRIALTVSGKLLERAIERIDRFIRTHY
jgi:aspartate/methionine/tyrosine aminotransferase